MKTIKINKLLNENRKMNKYYDLNKDIPGIGNPL